MWSSVLARMRWSLGVTVPPDSWRTLSLRQEELLQDALRAGWARCLCWLATSRVPQVPPIKMSS